MPWLPARLTHLIPRDVLAPLTDANRAALWAEVAILLVVGIIRFAHLTQGLVLVIAGRADYRPYWLAVVIWTGALAESLVVGRWFVRARRCTVPPIFLDMAFGLAAIMLMAVITSPGERITTFNWMLPYTVGAVILATAAHRGLGLVALALFATAYLVTTVGLPGASDRNIVANALANAANYPGFFLAMVVSTAATRTFARAYDDARGNALMQVELLSSDEERTRQQETLHRRALHVLHRIASGELRGAGAERRAALEVLSALRTELEPAGRQHDPLGLLARLSKVANELTTATTRVEFVGADTELQPRPDVLEALLAAVPEIVDHVAGFTRATRVLIWAGEADGGLVVTVRNRGTAARLPMSGLDASRKRLATVGATLRLELDSVDSQRVVLWLPID